MSLYLANLFLYITFLQNKKYTKANLLFKYLQVQIQYEFYKFSLSLSLSLSLSRIHARWAHAKMEESAARFMTRESTSVTV